MASPRTIRQLGSGSSPQPVQTFSMTDALAIEQTLTGYTELQYLISYFLSFVLGDLANIESSGLHPSPIMNFHATDTAPSKSVSIQLGDYKIGQDLSGNGTKSFYVYNTVTSDTVFNITGAGVVTAGLHSSSLVDSTSLGQALIQATNTVDALIAMGASTIGGELFTAADAPTAVTVLGGTTVGNNVLTAANAGAAQTALGGTTVGKAVFTAADAISALTAISAQNFVDLGFISKFRNGTLDIWQRATSISVTTAGAYTADGWIVFPTGATVTASKQAGRNLTVNSLQIMGASSVTGVTLRHRIESYIAAPLNSRQVTLQAWIYNGSGASFTPSISIGTPATADTFGAVNTANLTTVLNNYGLQACPNAAWTRVSYTFTMTSAAAKGIEVNFIFPALVATEYVQITELDIRLVNGSIVSGLQSAPPTPELRPIPNELLFCKRYFSKSYSQAIAPGTSVSAGTGGVYISGASSAVLGRSFSYGAVMRAVPTLTVYDNAGTSGKISTYASSSWTNGATLAGGTLTDNSAEIAATGACTIVNFDWTASAEL